MISLRKAKGIGVHYAPDADAIFSVALIVGRYPHLQNRFVKFLPAGVYSRYQLKQLEKQGLALIDVGGEQTGRDHHGAKKTKEAAIEMVAKELGLFGDPRLQPLINYVAGNDKDGTNYRLLNGAAADDLLFNNVIRASSQVRFNPMKEKISLEDRQQEFWRLVEIAELIISRFLRGENDAVSEADAVKLIQHSFFMAVAKSLSVSQPRYFSGFLKTAEFINRHANLDNDDDVDRFDFLLQPAFAHHCKLLENLTSQNITVKQDGKNIGSLADNPLVENLSLIGVAKELLADEMPYEHKLAILRNVWLSLIDKQADWLKAMGEMRNGAVKIRRDVRGWQVVMVESDCSQIMQATRYQQKNYHQQVADVSIAIRSTGHVQVTCSKDMKLRAKMINAGILLRQMEVLKGEFTTPPKDLCVINTLKARWYVADFGGLFNGSLTNPEVVPTQLTPEEIFIIVCEAIAK